MYVWFAVTPGPNFIELLKQNMLLNKFLLSRREHDTSHNFGKCDMIFWDGNPVLVSRILLCLATFLCLSSSMKLGPCVYLLAG